MQDVVVDLQLLQHMARSLFIMQNLQDEACLQSDAFRAVAGNGAGAGALWIGSVTS